MLDLAAVVKVSGLFTGVYGKQTGRETAKG